MVAGLEPDLRSHVEKRGYKNFEALLRSDIGAQQKLGADPSTLLRVPSQTRAENPSAWSDFDQALGVPQDGAYPEWKPTNGELNASEEGLKAFDAAMSRAGAPVSVRNAALEAFHDQSQAVRDQYMAQLQEEKAAGSQALQQEWGFSMPQKLQAAGLALNGIDGEDGFNELMTRYNLQDHPSVMKVLAGVAALRSETGMPSGGDQSKKGVQLSPAEAQAKRAELEQDEAFMTRYINGEETAVKEMLALNNAIIAGAA